MRQSIFVQSIVACVVVSSFAAVTRAQVSVEEAQHRLQEKLATRPATQPAANAAEIERLRAENLRLRERIMALETEVQTLKESLARASHATTGPTSRPAVDTGVVDPAAQKTLVGQWRGGDITTGSGYLLTFNADGTYQQVFTATGQRSRGQFRALSSDTMEMWSDKWPEDKPHNQYHFTASPVQIKLTPSVIDGSDVKNPRTMTLEKAE